MAMFVRVAVDAFPGIAPQWQQIVVFVAIASMVLGAFAAIGQRNIKRLMAYSSIGHMGFALVGLAAGTAEGVQGVLVYMAIYLAMTLGTFACILSMRRDGRHGREHQRSRRASRAPIRRWRSSSRCCCSRSPAFRRSPASSPNTTCSSPPSRPGSIALAVIGVLASVVGAYYYLLIVKMMYFDEPAEGFEPMPVELKAVLGVAGLFNLLFFVYPGAAGRRRRRGGEVAVLMQLDPTATRPASRLVAHDDDRLDQRRGAGARARRRARAAVGHRQAADRGPRPARPRLGLGAGQSLRQPAADRSGAAGARAGAVVRRGARAARRDRRRRRRGSAPRLALKWPNDLLLDGAKFAGILIEGGSAAAARGRDRHRRQLRAPSGRHAPIRRPTSPPRASRVDAGELFARAVGAPWRRGWRNGTAARASPRSAPTGSRAPPASARRSACALPTASSPAVSRGSTTPDGWCCACRRRHSRPSRPATSSRAAAGEATWRMAAPTASWCSRRSAASARSA